MATPTNSSGLLQGDALGTSQNFNAGFTFSAGSGAVAVISAYNGDGAESPTSVTISGTSATKIGSVKVNTVTLSIWFAGSVTGGTSTVNLAMPAGDNYVSFGVTEWEAGLITGYDTGTFNSANGESAAPTVSTAVSTSQADTLLFAGTVELFGLANANFNGPSGWTALFDEDDDANHMGGRGAWVQADTTGTKTAVFSSANTNWVAAIAAFTIEEEGGEEPQHYTLPAEQGSYSYTGQTATLVAGNQMSAEHGTYTLLGSDALRDIEMDAEQGSYALNGQTAGIVAARELLAEAGSYQLNGPSVELVYSAVLIVTSEVIRNARRMRAGRGFPFMGRF